MILTGMAHRIVELSARLTMPVLESLVGTYARKAALPCDFPVSLTVKAGVI